jgi:hypothetical protein
LPPLRGVHHFFPSLPALLTTFLSIAAAQAEAPRIHAITDVRIVTAPGQVIESGTVVLRDGLIESVGAGLEAPPDAQLIAGQDGWTVYPAFIDAASAVGLKSDTDAGPPAGRPGDGSERRGAGHEISAVHPEKTVVDQLDAAHTSIQRHRELGFAVAHVLPASGVFRGESAAMLLREASTQKLILADRVSQVIALETSSFMAKQYPSSSIGAVATVRQVLLDAQRHRLWTERYTENPAGMPRPEYRASDATLVAVLSGEMPIVFVSLRNLDPRRFNGFTAEFGLRGMTVARGLAHRAADLEAAEMPILLPLELPEPLTPDDADATDNTSLQELQAMVRAPRLPAALAEAGVDFAFVTAGMKSVRDFQANLAAVVAAGLTPEQALAAVTTVPARLLGFDRTLGTIEPGKQANLLVVEGELFTDKPGLRHLFVDGYHEAIEAEEIIGDPNAVVDPRGTWEILTEVMGRSAESTWTISGSEGQYKGYSESEDGGKNPFKNVDLRGNALTVVSDTSRGEFEITVVVTGDDLTGSRTMESPRGSATMRIDGRRIAGPQGDQQ